MPSKFINHQVSVFTDWLKFSLLAIFVFALGWCTPSQAGTTGKIAGRVTDAESGEALPGANVVIEETTLGAATDLNGNYVILNVPPGVYTVMFSYIGYQPVRMKEVRVSVDFTTTLNMKMKASTVEIGVVEVVGERQPLVRQDLTNTTVAVSAETIESLPVDAVQDVVRLQSGITVDNAGEVHIRGGRSNEIAYMVNGISVANPFNNAQAVGIATNAIQELTVSSGTFSAEYGDALSGVINFVTKDGSSKYAGNLKFWTGDNVSSHDELFDNIDDLDPLNNSRTEATFSGPVPFTGNRLTFFTSGVYVDNKGYLYGRRLYKPSDGLDISSTEWKFDPLGDGQPSGDGAVVPLNPSLSTNFTTKLSYRPVAHIKLTYDLLFDRFRYTSGDRRAYKFNPDGILKTKQLNQSHSIGITHTIGTRLFYTLKAAYSETNEKKAVFDDPHDPRYVPYNLANALPPTVFLVGGTDLDRDRLSSHTFNAKLDVVSQIRTNHELKLGAEVKVHRLEREFYTLIYDTTMARMGKPPIVPYRYLNPDYVDYSFYLRRPVQFSAYLLDKMELARTFIVNAGLRLEYLDTKADYNPDLIANVENPDQDLKRVDPKTRLSPRISLSYPITERGIIRFSYGHFYQLPTLQRLYQNPYFESFNYIRTPTYGNPNLKPERSIQYEMGLQQQLGDNFKFDVTVYYKDVTDLLQTRQVLAGAVAGDRIFNILTNVSYANVRGFSFSLLKRRGLNSPFSASLDYTFQIAEGNFSDPADNFYDSKSGKETEQTFVFLDFDRTHTLNGTFALTQPNNWTASVIASFWTGTPYTPSLPSSLTPVQFQENSGRRPTYLNVDFRAEKFFKFAGLDFSVFTQIENALDLKNERYVYSNSGRSLYSLDEKLQAGTFNNLRERIRANPELYPPESELDKYYQRADWLSEPREVRVGFSVAY
ncbi:MAG: TonB-dependent receptor [candidate division KSB1 bacterium]|nr:TonB-dependent receptor [candidate division KSB1 bacterium]MDZ7303190.1 TonB-dependent receptor [candidate division KSB1 bacterium]MDZ7312198.1 TonB-dependent receptor [candidate division KSB1 bacterium]